MNSTSESKNPAARKPKPPFPKQSQPAPGSEAELEPKPKYEAPLYRPAHKLEGKIALITGGDSGIGRAVAVLYAREGADVAISYLPEEEEDAHATQEAVEETGRRCLLLPGDLSEASFCREVVERTVAEYGALDILVSNAAYQHRKDRIEDIEDQEWEHTLSVNITAYFRLAKAAVPHMKRGSSIIATSSIVGLRGSAELLDYGASKGAMDAFTKSLAKSLADRGIRVNAVAPGPVWTPLNVQDRGMDEEGVSKFGEKVPFGRPGQPEEIAPLYVFLASEADSSYLTGEVIAETGGETTAG